MSRFVRGLFQTARTISTIDPTALTGAPGGPSPSPGWNVCSMVQMFVRTVVRMRVIVSYSLLFISILLNIFCPYFSILLDFIFSRAIQSLFSFCLPSYCVSTRRQSGVIPTFRRGLFSQFAYNQLIMYSEAINRLGSQPSEVSAISTPRHLQPAVATGR